MAQPVTQRQVIHSEWIKLRTVRSSWLVLGATVLGIVVTGLLVSYATNAHWSTMTASSRAHFSPVNQDLIGVNLAELTVGVLGVLAVTGEYTSGMIRATFAAVPRRVPVLLAKAGIIAAVTFAVCLAAVLVTFLGGQALLGAHGISLGQPEAVRAVLGKSALGYTESLGIPSLRARIARHYAEMYGVPVGADRVIVTSDNPRSEDPAAIIEEILVGSGQNVEHEVDRRVAIDRVIATASPGDVVVIAGKGHEQGQEFEAGRKVPFDDVTVVRESLQRTLSASR